MSLTRYGRFFKQCANFHSEDFDGVCKLWVSRIPDLVRDGWRSPLARYPSSRRRPENVSGSMAFHAMLNATRDTDESFVHSALSCLNDQLLAAGWQKVSFGRRYAIRINEETVGTVFFNRATHRTQPRLSVNPIVGVQNTRLERELVKILGHPLQPGGVSTVADPLGYLKPEGHYEDWPFGLESNVEAEVARLMDAIVRFGLAFVRQNDTLEKLTRTMDSPEHAVWSRRFYLPIAYLLLGNRGRAKELIDDFPAAIEKDDPWRKEFIVFANRFRDFIDE